MPGAPIHPKALSATPGAKKDRPRTHRPAGGLFCSNHAARIIPIQIPQSQIQNRLHSSRHVVFVCPPRHTGVHPLGPQVGAVDFDVTVAWPPTGVNTVARSVEPAGPLARATASALARVTADPSLGKGVNGK